MKHILPEMCTLTLLTVLLHCRGLGYFPAGLILHSYAGSAEMVQSLAKHNAYFSFSGFITNMKPEKAKRILQAVCSLSNHILSISVCQPTPNTELLLAWILTGTL